MVMIKMTETNHWIDTQAEKIISERGNKQRYVFNSGMSISGRMHVGNLRGELVIPSRIEKALKEKGKEVEFKGVYYTQDRFKGKDEQLQDFKNKEEARKYIGWRLIDVPDPKGCHKNWVEHYNSENDPYLKEFGININPITTTEFYKMKETKELVKLFLGEKEKVRQVLNKFRERKPYPKDWIPFDPLCEKCNRIDKTKATKVNLEENTVQYECRACGDKGSSRIEKGKLAWRLEWASLWNVLEVDFEPYGKDHATPGGSRDSCIALCKEFNLDYPAGFAYNWVYLKKDGKPKVMTSSGNIGITTQRYLEIGNPEILNYLYLSTKPMKEIYFDPKEIPIHYRHFDSAEKVYYEEKEAKTEKREENIKRNYELAVNKVQNKQPQRVPYDFCATIAQITKNEEKRKNILMRTGHLENPSKRDLENALKRIELAGNWVENYAPQEYIYEVLEERPENIEIDQEVLKIYREVADLVEKGSNGQEIQQFIYERSKEEGISPGKAFKAGYNLIIGRNRGPRLGPFIASLDPEQVTKILKN